MSEARAKRPPCAHCGKDRGFLDGDPPSIKGWCNAECSAAYYAAHPEEAAQWIAVGDMSPLQRAELEAVLGLGAKA